MAWRRKKQQARYDNPDESGQLGGHENIFCEKLHLREESSMYTPCIVHSHMWVLLIAP